VYHLGSKRMLHTEPQGIVSPNDLSPEVSVIIPCYNCVRFVRQTIDSVLMQDGVSFEIIAVNDGSTDGTLALLESIPEIGKVITQTNSGSGAARNTGAAAARGKYLHFLDSDDLLLPGAMRTLVALLDDTEAGFAYGQATWIDVDGKRTTDSTMGYHSPGKNTMQAVCRGALFQPSAGMFRRDIFDKVGGFYTPGDSEDWELLFRYAGLSEGVMSPKAVLEYRYHVQSKTRNYPNIFENSLAILSVNRAKYGLWYRYPFSCLAGLLKVGFYFSSEYLSTKRDPQAEYTELARQSIRRHPWVRLIVWMVPPLSHVKRALRARRNAKLRQS
jgi:glycosyltransferase involved in cell wall biosynthesis